MEIQDGDRHYPSWWELDFEAEEGWRGRFVGEQGSARPIFELQVTGNKLSFSLPPQYEERTSDLSFSGTIEGDRILGTLRGDDGQFYPFVALRAPELAHTAEPEWGEPVELLGEDLENWRLRVAEGPSGWTLNNGVLVNRPPSVDLLTVDSFGDFRLELEFRLPERSNSGIYLRGRYEIQINESYGRELTNRSCGSVYGFLTPTIQAAKPAGEWNRCEITLLGRKVTVILNGSTILEEAEIPGITGGAIDSNEGEPGPLLLQGDHGAVEFRNIVVYPRRE